MSRCPVGFIIPDLDFDSSDALIPITDPFFSDLHFDPGDEFQRVNEVLSRKDIDETVRALERFRTSILQNPEKEQLNFSVINLFVALINENVPPIVVVHAMDALVAWTGATTIDADAFVANGFVNTLFNIAITNLSTPNLDDTQRIIGRGAIGVLRNLAFTSNQCRTALIKMGAIKLLVILYYEVLDINLTRAIGWVLRNLTLVETKPEWTVFEPIVSLMKQAFGYGVAGVTEIEVLIAGAYLQCGNDYKRHFLTEIDILGLCKSFAGFADSVQLAFLDILIALVEDHDPVIVSNVWKRMDLRSLSNGLIETCKAKVQCRFLDLVKTMLSVYQEKELSDTVSNTFVTIIGLMKPGIRYKVRIQAVNTIEHMIQSDIDLLNVIVACKVTRLVTPLLESGWPLYVNLALKILLEVLQYALAGRSSKGILDDFIENEISILVDAAEQTVENDERDLFYAFKTAYHELEAMIADEKNVTDETAELT